MLPGDIDEMGCNYLSAFHDNLRAPVLVFPHHGGNVHDRATAADNENFAEKLMTDVRPDAVLFSVSRTRFSNPRPEIVDQVRQHSADVRIACTQLSAACRPVHDDPPDSAFSHLLALHARGAKTQACCGGTLRIELDGNVLPTAAAHLGFKQAFAPTALCLS
jgi:competence protein ComEC